MSWVEAELREQPAALRRLLAAESAHAVGLAQHLTHADVRYFLIVSRGSSSNAARYAQYLLGTRNGYTVSFATPSLYTLYDSPPRLGGAAAIAISQSGASPDVVAVLAEARRQGCPTLAITNDVTSPLAQAAEWTLPLHAGEERAVAATKTYLNSIGAVALLSAALGGDGLDELARIPDLVGAQIDRSLADASAVDRYRDADGGVVVARGVNYGTAFEIALKIRELSGAAFEPFSSADLLHGPIAALGPNRPLVLIAPTGRAFASLRDDLPRLRERGAPIVAITDDDGLLADADTRLPLAGSTPEWLSPLVTVIPGQVTALRLATLRGGDVDSPPGLTKITRTR
jgi:glucosamine--fructose-6-phosphate aminotransferase (isomerizing)